MKQKAFGLVLSLALLLLLLGGCAVAESVDHAVDRAEDRLETARDAAGDHSISASQEKPQPTGETSSVAPLSKEDAEQIALEHVGKTADQVQFLRTEYEVDDGVPQFDVEFHEGNVEYEFEIHAESGKILSFDKDR